MKLLPNSKTKVEEFILVVQKVHNDFHVMCSLH